MIQLIKKGGLRERANRSRKYQGSENTATTLKPNRYSNTVQQAEAVTIAQNKTSERTDETKTSE